MFSDNSPIQSTTAVKQEISVHRIYTKNSNFESVTLTKALLNNPPNTIIEMKAQIVVNQREEETYETVLILDLIGKANGDLLWRAQLQQAGLYTLVGFTEKQKKQILNGYCINQLYPYACSVATHMVVNGGFAPIYLGPMDFELLYQEQQKKESDSLETPSTAIKH